MSGKDWRGKKKPAPIEEEDDVDEEIGSEAEDIGDEDDDVIVTRQRVVDADIQVPRIIKHVTTSNVGEFLDIYIPFSITASLAELEANQAAAEFKIPEDMLQNLQMNIKDKDRDQLTSETLAGDVRKIVPVDLIMVEHSNGHDVALNMTCNQLMGKLHNGAMWHYPPNHVSSVVNQPILKVKSFISEQMLKDRRNYTVADIDEIIQVDEKAQRGRVELNSIGHQFIMNGIESNAWPSTFTRSQLKSLTSTEVSSDMVSIPLQVALDTKAALIEPIQDLDSRCLNFQTIRWSIERADKKPFCAAAGVNNQLVGQGIDPDAKMAGMDIHTRRTTYGLMRFYYKAR